MDKLKEKMGKARMGKTGKKIMKKTRTGQWLAVAVIGVISLGTNAVSVGATEQSGEDVGTEQVEQADISEDGAVTLTVSDDVVWVANTSEQIASEMEKQSNEKQQDPLHDYTITWGDTLSVIAQVTGSTVEELAEINNIENVDLIYAGAEMVLADGTVIRVGEDVAQEPEQELEQEPEQETAPETEVEVTEDAGTETVNVPEDVEDADVSNDESKDVVDEADVSDDVTNDDDADVSDDLEDEGTTPDDSGAGTNPGGIVETPVTPPVTPPTDEDNDGDTTNPDEGDTTTPDEGDTTTPDEGDTTTPDEGDTTTPDEDNDGDEGEVGEDEVIEEVTPDEEPIVEETDPEGEGEGETPNVPEPSETPVDPENTEPDVNETTPVPVPQEPSENGEEEQTPVIGVSERTESSQLGYTVVRRGTSDLFVGEERTVQEGSFGTLVKTYEVTYADGVEVSAELVSELVTVDPVNTIIEFGTKAKPVITTANRTETSQIGYTRVRRANPNMEVGQERTVQEGRFGTLVRTYKVTYEDGVEISKEFVSEEVTVAPENTIIEYGTKAVPVITEDTRAETETVAFEVEYRDNPEMLVGQERTVQEGVNGVRTKLYEQTFTDGVLSNEVLVYNEVTTAPQNRIIEVGTREANLVDTVLGASDAEKYDLAVNGLPFDVYGLTANLTQEEREELANSVDHTKLVQEMDRLLNSHRANLGLSTLQHQSEFDEGSQLIVNTLADYGYIAPDGSRGHTLPDGSLTLTVFSDDLRDRGIGENLALRYIQNNPYQMVSERYLAEQFFNQWLNSEGHRLNMEREYYTGFTFAVQSVTNGNTKVGSRDSNGNHVIDRTMESYEGFGVVGVMTLIVD